MCTVIKQCYIRRSNTNHDGSDDGRLSAHAWVAAYFILLAYICLNKFLQCSRASHLLEYL